MNDDFAPGIFESFNARNVPARQVAETFIPNSHFEQVAGAYHCLLIGPRGSGKTTLLKMLQPAALRAWEGEAASAYREKIQYTGVFIAAERSWYPPSMSPSASDAPSGWQATLGRAALTTHVLRAIVRSIRGRLRPGHTGDYLSASLEEAEIAELVGELRSPWHINPSLNSLRSLEHALTFRLSEIGELVSKCSKGEDDLAGYGYLDLHFLKAASAAIQVFDDLIGQPDSRWALCFDELEVAPPPITAELFAALRSDDEKILLKFALAPFSPEGIPAPEHAPPSSGDDYREVRLWNARKEDNYRFCEALLQGILKDRGWKSLPSGKELLGASIFDTNQSEWQELGTSYRAGTKIHSHFVSLSLKDPSFSKYLKRNKIDVAHLEAKEGIDRAKELRKVASLVITRDVFMKGDGGEGLAGRSRKNPDPYTGASSIFAISEGNPRWFIGLISEMLGQHNTTGQIPRNVQAQAVRRASHAFRMRLRLIPSKEYGSRIGSALSIVDTVGTSLANRALRAEFVPEYFGSFTVDSDCSQETQMMIGIALNAGALVYVPDVDSEGLLADLKGKRFRLAYLLAPHYKLPLLIGKSLSLGFLANSASNQESLDLGEEP